MLVRLRSEHGAVAVMTAILAVALIGVAAIAVDLGNGFARKRMLQTQADLAALAGAGSLPNDSAAIQAATDYLVANEVVGDQSFADLTDGQRGNGEITVRQGNTRIEVVTPPATVGVGLGRALGQSDYDVQAVAEAEIRSPARILPFFIPVGCAAPAGEIVIKAGAQSESDSSPTEQNFFGPTSNSAQAASISSVTPLTVATGTPTTLLIRGESYADNTGNAGAVVMQVGFVKDDDQEGPFDVTAGQVTLNTGAPTLDEIEYPLPPEVYDTPGRWFVQVRKLNGNANATSWSRATNSSEAGYVFRVGEGFDPADACGEKQTGDFGLLDSPRALTAGGEITQSQQRLDLNIAKGIDHSVSRFLGALPSPSEADNCRVSPANTPISGGVLDVWESITDSPNCMNIFNGNKVDSATDGLIMGGALDGGFQGKLDAPASECVDTTDARPQRSLLGKQINDDKLSCFLELGSVQSLVESSDASATRLSSDIFSAPRFFFVPVLNYTVNPPNGFYPIVGWRAVFITDEYSGLTEGNGLKASNTKLTEIRVVYFQLSKLPPQIDGSGQPTTEYLGEGTKIAVLIK